MGIRFRCGSCEKKFELDPKHAGKKMRCPKCGATNQVPSESAPDGEPVLAQLVGDSSRASQRSAGATAHATAHATTTAAATAGVTQGGLAESSNGARPRRRPNRDGSNAGPARTPRRPQGDPVGAAEEGSAMGFLKNLTPMQLGIGGGAFVAVMIVVILLASGGSGAPTDTGDPTGTGETGGVALNGDAGTEEPADTEPEPEPFTITGPTRLEVPGLGPDQWREVPNFGRPSTVGQASNAGDTEGSDESAAVNADETPTSEPEMISDAPVWIGQNEMISLHLGTSGGTGTARWSLDRGTTLPAGMTLVSSGILRGRAALNTPADRPHEWALVATDEDGTRRTTTVRVHVVPELRALPANDFPLELQIGRPIRYDFRAVGGVAPYRWRVVDGAAVSGLELDSATGVLRGSPEERSRFNVTIAVFDARYPEAWDETAIAREAARVELRRINVQPASEMRVRGDPPPMPERPDDVVVEPLAAETNLDESDEYRAPGREELEQINQLARQAMALMQAGNHEEARPLLEQIIEIDQRNNSAHYNLACCLSLLGEVELAVEHLTYAINNGFTDFDHIRNDSDLDPIRESEAYVALMSDTDSLMEAVARRQLDSLKEEWPGYLTHIDTENKLLFATNQNQAVLDDLIDRITNFAEVIWRDHNWAHPDYYITIILPSSGDFTRYKQQRGVPMGVGGWYSPSERLLISGTVGHVLTHEFTHALHFADLGAKNIDHNIWFKEGLATLYEDSELPNDATGDIKPVHSLRMRNAKDRARPSFRELFSMAHRPFMADFGRRTLIHYGMSRYVTFWLYEQGKLDEFYQAYVRTQGDGRDGRAGITAMVEVFDGRELEDIQAEWEEWMADLTPPSNSSDTFLGVTLYREVSELGPQVADVVAGSPAEAAGIRPEDYINQVAGQPIDSMHGFVGALERYKAGDVVVIKVIRQFQDVRTGLWRQEPVELRVELGEKDDGRRR